MKLAGTIVLLLLIIIILSVAGCSDKPATPTSHTIVDCDDFGGEDCWCSYKWGQYEVCDGFVPGQMVCDWYWDLIIDEWVEMWCFKPKSVTTTGGGGVHVDTTTTTTTTTVTTTDEQGCSRPALSGDAFENSFVCIPDGWVEYSAPSWDTYPVDFRGEMCDYTMYQESYINGDGWGFLFQAFDYVEYTGFDGYEDFANGYTQFDGTVNPITIGGAPGYELLDPAANTAQIVVSFGNGIYVWGSLTQLCTVTIHLWMDAFDDSRTAQGGCLDAQLYNDYAYPDTRG